MCVGVMIGCEFLWRDDHWVSALTAGKIWALMRGSSRVSPVNYMCCDTVSPHMLGIWARGSERGPNLRGAGGDPSGIHFPQNEAVVSLKVGGSRGEKHKSTPDPRVCRYTLVAWWEPLYILVSSEWHKMTPFSRFSLGFVRSFEFWWICKNRSVSEWKIRRNQGG